MNSQLNKNLKQYFKTHINYSFLEFNYKKFILTNEENCYTDYGYIIINHNYINYGYIHLKGVY